MSQINVATVPDCKGIQWQQTRAEVPKSNTLYP